MNCDKANPEAQISAFLRPTPTNQRPFRTMMLCVYPTVTRTLPISDIFSNDMQSLRPPECSLANSELGFPIHLLIPFRHFWEGVGEGVCVPRRTPVSVRRSTVDQLVAGYRKAIHHRPSHC